MTPSIDRTLRELSGELAERPTATSIWLGASLVSGPDNGPVVLVPVAGIQPRPSTLRRVVCVAALHPDDAQDLPVLDLRVPVFELGVPHPAPGASAVQAAKGAPDSLTTTIDVGGSAGIAAVFAAWEQDKVAIALPAVPTTPLIEPAVLRAESPLEAREAAHFVRDSTALADLFGHLGRQRLARVPPVAEIAREVISLAELVADIAGDADSNGSPTNRRYS
ncbi:MAG: hypothetical protein R2878_01070 [Thermoleophilia bacterium]